jgi:hypothetical protein
MSRQADFSTALLTKNVSSSGRNDIFLWHDEQVEAQRGRGASSKMRGFFAPLRMTTFIFCALAIFGAWAIFGAFALRETRWR